MQRALKLLLVSTVMFLVGWAGNQKGPVALDATGAATDITTRNASITAHGLLKKLDNTASHYMDGSGAWSTPAGGGGGGTPTGVLSGLTVNCTSTFTSTKLSIAVGSISMTDGSTPKLFTTVNVTLDISTSGRGGLDTGSPTAFTGYDILLIGKSDGTVDSLAVISRNTPVLPSGFTYSRVVSWALLESTGKIDRYQQVGNLICFADGSDSALTPVSGGTATTYTEFHIPQNGPPGAVNYIMYVYVAGSSSAAVGQVSFESPATMQNINAISAYGRIETTTLLPFYTDVLDSGRSSCYYKVNSGSNTSVEILGIFLNL